MVRLADLQPSARKVVTELDCPVFDSQPWVGGPPLAQRRVTLVSSAGLMRRGEPTVGRGETGYREISHREPAENLLMSHVSVNFDRTGFQQDLNVVLPRERLDELVAEGFIGAAAETHYSFMGATDPRLMETNARRLAARLLEAEVDTAVLLPV